MAKPFPCLFLISKTRLPIILLQYGIIFIISKAEKLKEQIGWLKVAFGLATAILVSLVGWMATHYETSATNVLVMALALSVFFAVSIVYINKKAFEKIDELEEL